MRYGPRNGSGSAIEQPASPIEREAGAKPRQALRTQLWTQTGQRGGLEIPTPLTGGRGHVPAPKLHCDFALGQVLGPHVDRGEMLGFDLPGSEKFNSLRGCGAVDRDPELHCVVTSLPSSGASVIWVPHKRRRPSALTARRWSTGSE